MHLPCASDVAQRVRRLNKLLRVSIGKEVLEILVNRPYSIALYHLKNRAVSKAGCGSPHNVANTRRYELALKDKRELVEAVDACTATGGYVPGLPSC